MKLQHRFLLWLLPSLIVIYLLSQVVQGILSHRSLMNLEDTTFKALEDAAVQCASSLEAANVNSIMEWMMEGDMERVEGVMRQQREVESVLEFSLYGETKEVAYSSHKEQIGQALPPEIAREIDRTKKEIIQYGRGGIEIYRPIMGEERCNECHAYGSNEIAGITLLRISTETMDTAKATWVGSMSDLQEQELVMGSSTAMVLILIMGVLAYITVRRLVAKPFTALAARLRSQSARMRQAARTTDRISRSIAEGANQSAAALEQSHASAEEISGTTKSNAEIATRAQRLGTEARQAADQGTLDMAAMKQAMNEIEAGSSEIASIIKTIDEIAFQTNMLALNAAVEAARAGEAGMGFAVVAEEVRNLAQRAAKAAHETTERIETSLERTRHGAEINAKVALSLEQIAAKTREFDELVDQVARASQEQSKGIQQLSVGLSQMDSVTQTNAAHANEGAESASALKTQSELLGEAVQHLEVLVFGSAEGGAQGRHPHAHGATVTSSSPEQEQAFEEAFEHEIAGSKF